MRDSNPRPAVCKTAALTAAPIALFPTALTNCKSGIRKPPLSIRKPKILTRAKEVCAERRCVAKESPPKFCWLLSVFQQSDDEGGPTGLVAGAQSAGIVSVKVFVEQEQVFPRSIAPVLRRIAVAGSLSVFVEAKNGNQAFLNLFGNSASRAEPPFSGRKGNGQRVAVEVLVAFQSL